MVSNNQGDTDNRFNGLSTFLFFNAACGKQLFSEIRTTSYQLIR
jgi:hypothetical protein